jgi:hypothetical protein
VPTNAVTPGRDQEEMMAEVEVGPQQASGADMAGPEPTTVLSASRAEAGDGGSPTPPARASLGPPDRLRALAPIIVFDVAGPLGAYYGARFAGMSTVLALVVSGVLPAVRVLATVVQHRRLDVIGGLVLSGIALGTVMGLASGSARLYLLDGIVPTVVLGFVCLLSLLSHRPVMFRVALETMGEDTAKGRAFAEMWQYAEFRRIFRVITVVWGLVFLAESAVQAVIVETSSINTAKQTSNLLPVAVLVLTFAWTRNYGRRAEERGEDILDDPGDGQQGVFP